MYLMKPMPTVRQQVARATVQLGLKRRQIDTVATSGRSYSSRRVASPDPDKSTYVDAAAMGVAIKLTKAAFSRYAVGCEAIADRGVPGTIITSGMDYERFADLVRVYTTRCVKPGNEFTVIHFDGRIYLRVSVRASVVTPKKRYFAQLAVQ